MCILAHGIGGNKREKCNNRLKPVVMRFPESINFQLLCGRELLILQVPEGTAGDQEVAVVENGHDLFGSVWRARTARLQEVQQQMHFIVGCLQRNPLADTIIVSCRRGLRGLRQSAEIEQPVLLLCGWKQPFYTLVVGIGVSFSCGALKVLQGSPNQGSGAVLGSADHGRQGCRVVSFTFGQLFKKVAKMQLVL